MNQMSVSMREINEAVHDLERSLGPIIESVLESPIFVYSISAIGILVIAATIIGTAIKEKKERPTPTKPFWE